MKWADLGALFTPSEKTKLAGVDTGATDDQTGAEIKALYEAEANAYTDGKNTFLSSIEYAAKDDQTNTEIRDAVEAATNSNTFTDADHTKLNGVDSGAKDDQTGAEIKTAYEGEADTNAYDDAAVTKLSGVDSGATKYPDTGEQAFLDADHTKLDEVSDGADVTDKANVETAGAVMALSKHFDYADLNAGNSIGMGSIPAHSYVIRTQIHVSTAFNASGTDVCELGYSGDANAYGLATNIESNGIKNPSNGVAMGYSATARTAALRPRAGIATDATAGAAVAIVEYFVVGAA